MSTAHKISNLVTVLLSVVRRELGRFRHDKMLLILMFIIPPFLFSLFAIIYNKGMVLELPIAIYDEDKSELSRLITSAIESSSAMKIVAHVSSIRDIEDGIKKEKFLGAYYFPYDMERNVKSNRPASPILYKNSQNIIVCNFLLREGTKILGTYNAGSLLKKLRLSGLTELQALSIVNPILVDFSPLYNANFNYLSFLSPGLIFAQFQMIIMLASLLLICREYEQNTIREGIQKSRNNVLFFLLCKSMPYLMIHAATALGIIGVLFPIFHIQITGSFLYFYIFTLLFIVASFVPGLLIGALIHDSFYATEVAIFYNMPGFIFSGYTFPLWAVPMPLVIVSQLMPFTHFYTGFFKLAQMNTPLHNVFPECLQLFLFVVLPMPIIITLINRSIRKCNTL